MCKNEILIQEIDQVPDTLLDEVLDFIRYLKSRKVAQSLETLITSESSLKKDWLKPEEDIAWSRL